MNKYIKQPKKAVNSATDDCRLSTHLPRPTYMARFTSSTYMRFRAFVGVLHSENLLSSQPPALMFIAHQTLAFSPGWSSSVLIFVFFFYIFQLRNIKEDTGSRAGGAGVARQWSSSLCRFDSWGVTGSGKLAGRILAGRSPRVRGNVPSSAVDLSSRAARWRRRGGSAAGWDGEVWSRRGRGRDEDAAEGGRGEEKRS